MQNSGYCFLISGWPNKPITQLYSTMKKANNKIKKDKNDKKN